VGRLPKLTRDDILDAALCLVADGGPAAVTIDAIAAALGGNVGSIYHRFPSKSAILATLWLRCARNGRQGFLKAARLPDVDEAVLSCITHYPRWARKSLGEARLMAAFGREQLVGAWPEHLEAELAGVNQELDDALDQLTARRFGQPTRAQRNAITTALLDLPAGAIRRHLLAGRPPPATVDPLITAASLAYLEAL
jgi:AcrR family transcriptional regulator